MGHGDGSRPLKKWDSHKKLEFFSDREPSLCIFEVNCMSKVENLSKSVDRLQVMVDKNQKTVENQPIVNFRQYVNFHSL
jgi:hypothetical protein